MESKFVIEAIKTALIASVKKNMPKGGYHCKVCDTPFNSLHRINIHGIGVYYMCGQCVEELREYFIKQEQSVFDDVFQEQIGFILGQRELHPYIEEDWNDWGSYSDHAHYYEDRYD